MGEYSHPDTSTIAQPNKPSAASAKRQGILQRFVGPKYPHYHHDETNIGEHFNFPRDRAKANFESDKYKKAWQGRNKNEPTETESVDPESALYIRELTKDWADVNQIIPDLFIPVKNSLLNESQPKEIWVETTR